MVILCQLVRYNLACAIGSSGMVKKKIKPFENVNLVLKVMVVHWTHRG